MENGTTENKISERQKMLRGDMFCSFEPEMIADRTRCHRACHQFNQRHNPPRREMVRLWRDITGDTTPLPPTAPTAEEDEAQFESDPWVEAPVMADYGYNVRLAQDVFINFNATFIDSLPITIGARTLVGPACSFYSGTHPLDPFVRNGTRGPEMGKPIVIGEDCWLGGNVIVLPGVTIGRGSTVGAGSVVTKDVPAFCVVAGNPARVLKKIDVDVQGDKGADQRRGAEEPMARDAEMLENERSKVLSG